MASTTFVDGETLVVADWLNDVNDAVYGGITTTLNVPSVYATIQAALDYIEDKTISAGSTVTIQVADGTYNLSAGLTINHPQGSLIRLVGNETTPANVVLSVAGAGFDCLTVSNGHTLGYLNGFKFYKTVKALAADNTTAILANNGATIICGDDIVVDNWYYGIAARNGSTIECDYAQVDHSGDVGIWAFCGSFVQCRNAVSNNAIDVANNLGFGIQAEYGSSVDCQSASATGCRIAGIAALSNSHVRSLSSTTSTNTGSGLLARDGGTIEAHGATSSSNTRYGIESIADGHTYYSSITTSGNTISNHAPKAYFDNTEALGARIVSDDGDFRIDSSGAYSIYFNTSGGAQFGIGHLASATSYLTAIGSTVGAPHVVASGAASNIDAGVRGKGTGSIFLGQNQTNYVRINPKGTGVSPVIAPEGETNLDLNIEGKGSGVVQVPASTTTRSSLRVPHGTAPSSPVNGDMWTTTAGLYVRINGATVGPLS